MRWNSIWCIKLAFMMGLYGDFEQLKSELFDEEKDCISIENCGELGNAMFR